MPVFLLATLKGRTGILTRRVLKDSAGIGSRESAGARNRRRWEQRRRDAGQACGRRKNHPQRGGIAQRCGAPQGNDWFSLRRGGAEHERPAARHLSCAPRDRATAASPTGGVGARFCSRRARSPTGDRSNSDHLQVQVSAAALPRLRLRHQGSRREDIGARRSCPAASTSGWRPASVKVGGPK